MWFGWPGDDSALYLLFVVFCGVFFIVCVCFVACEWGLCPSSGSVISAAAGSGQGYVLVLPICRGPPFPDFAPYQIAALSSSTQL